MRIRGAKTELEEAGESTEGMAESTASLREEILALSGVDIMQDANTFKSTYAIMDELAEKWEGLSDIAQASITELIAGKHQGNVMSSLMSNFDIARNALETSQNSAGSALAEHAKWSDSLEARLNKLKATWQSLSQSFMSSSFLKGGISAITGFVDVIDTLVDKFGALPTLIGAFAGGLSLFKNEGIFKFDKNTNSIRAFNIELSNMAKTYSSLKSSIGDYNLLASQQKSLIKQQSLLTNLSKKNSLGKQGVQLLNQQELIEQQSKIEKQQRQLTNTQENFNKSIAQSNANLANYFSGLNGGKASIAGYIASLVKAKVATIALQAATMAMNAALTMGISALISWGVSAISKWINEANDLAEKVDEITSKYKDQHSELMKLKGDYDTTNEDSMISKYGELSKGVDAFGRNLSLTADEYAEYQNVVNSIADQIPSLVSGYDSQGNAILSCAGNVKELTKAYENLIKAQNNEVLLNSAEDINKDFKNAVKDAEYNTKGWFGGANWTQELGFGSTKLSTKSAEIYKNIVNSTDAISEFKKALTADEYGSETFLEGLDVSAMSKLLENAGFEKNGEIFNKEQDIVHVQRALEENKALVKNIVDQYYSDLEVEAEGKRQQAQAALSNAFDISDSIYSGMSDTMKNIAKQTVSSFDFGFFADLEEQGISVETYINNMLDQLNNLGNKDNTSIEAAFDLKTKFNGGEISYGEYVDGLESAGDLVDGLVLDGKLGKEVGTQIKLSLGLDESGIVENYENLTNRLKDIGLEKSDAESLLDNLSSQELSVLTKIIPEIDANATREQIEAAIDREMVLSGLIFDLNLEVEAAGIESLNTALSETVTASGLSSESISALKSRYADLESQGWDLSSMFEETSHGIHLNRNELSKFENELSKQKLEEVNGDLAKMKSEYDKLGEAIKNASDSEKASLFNERQNLAQKIADAATLASQYQGLTSAYNQWLAAESSGNERDMYENVISGLNTVKDELSRGWTDDSTVAFLEMLTGKTDLAGKSGKELKEIYDSLDKTIKNTNYSIKDFFTVDKDGNSTSKGVYNFLDAIGQLEEEAFGGKDVVKRDGKGNVIGFDFNLVGGDKAIADALGISEELVQIMVRAADDAGFVVSMDGTYKQLADLQNEARASVEVINDIFDEEYSFDFNTSSIDSLESQLEQIDEILNKTDKNGKKLFWNDDGTFNFDVKGATEAMTIASTLQAKLDTLSQDKYGIGLTVEDKDFEKPLAKMQEYGRTVATLNQLKLNPVANAADIEKLEGDLNAIAKDLIDLSNKGDIDIGIDADDDVTDVREKLENGEIKIPTVLDIQTNMDKNISDLKDIALLTSGLLSEEEARQIKIRLGIEVEGELSNDDKKKVEESINTVVEGVNNGTTTVEPEIKVDPKVSESDADTKVEDSVNKIVEGVNNGTTTVEPTLEIKPASEVTVSDSFKGEVKTGMEGHLAGMGVVDVNTDVNVNANVDTSNAEKEVSDKTNEAVENQSGETTTLEKDVQLEFNINDYVDELSKFKDVAKELEGLDDITVKINANLEGELNSDDVAKLKEFAEGAKELKGASNKDISIKANFEGNLSDGKGIENLAQFANGAKELKGAKSSEITITANFDGSYLDADSDDINNLAIFADGAKKLKGIENIDVSVTANLEGTLGSWTGDIDDLTTFADQAKALQGVKNSDVTVNANIEGNITNESVTRLKNFAEAINLLPKSAVNISVKASVDTGSINNAITLLQKVSNSGLFKDYNASVTVTFNKESGEVDSYDPPEHTRTVTYKKDSSAVDSYDPPNLTRTVTYHIVTVGGAGAGGGGDIHSAQAADQGWYWANGTAHANGTAFADGTVSGRAFKAGDWRTKESGVALMGELGRELIVRDGRFFTVGDNGAGFFPYKKGDIIFNHRQTEELFKNGYVTSNGGRGTALASGTAFAEGTAFSGGIGGNGSGGSGGSSSSSSKSKKSKSKDDEDDDSAENKNFDWIEKLLERFDRAIDMLDKAANNIYKSFDKRNTSLVDEIAKVKEQIANQEKAYKLYLEKAEYVGKEDGFNLSEEWKKKIRDGDFSSSVLNSEDDKELIKYIELYEERYEKALKAEEAVQELNETLSSLYALMVENVATKYEGILGVVEHEKNILEEYINRSEAQAWLVSSKYYDALASNERETIAELENQKAEMLMAFDEAMDSGTIDEGSESWYEMVASIDEVTLAIEESKTQLLEYEQTIQQLSWEVFDLLQDKISSVSEETDFLIDLLSNKKLYDDNGQLTNEGSATMGLHGVAYNTYMHQADLAAEEIAKLKKELEEDPFDTELEERYREMVALQQEYILSAESERDAIKSLVEEGIQLEIEALNERIEKYNEALDSQKDLYEYQKKVKEQTKEIASLEKQIAAYQGDDSEEARQKIQQIKVDLEEARADLEETEYDKLIEDSQKLLDNLVLEYEETLNMRLDNIDSLIADMITEINTDAGVIGDTIREAANSVGYTLTDSMKTIWSEDSASTKNVITTYGDKFVNAQTTTNNALNNINTNLQNMVNKLDKEAKDNTKSASTSSVAKSSSTKTTTATTTTTKKTSGGDGTPKIGDRVKYVSGQYYYDSQGKKPLGSHNQGEYVYITNINTKDWATHGYHISTGNKLGKGDLGWLKLNQISGYSSGKKNFANDEIAWTQEDGKEFIVRPSDGAILTPVAKGDSILTSTASKNIWDMANSPYEFIKENLRFGTDNIPNNSNVQNNYTQYLDKVVFSLPNVKNYDEFLSTMQKDKNFERLVHSMTIDRINGKSSLAKSKSIR